MAIMQIGRFHFETTTVSIINRLSNYVIIVFEKKNLKQLLATSLVERPSQQCPTIVCLSVGIVCVYSLS